MKNRSIAAVVLLPFVTLGIYTIYWFVSTKGELNKKGANIPTAFLIIIPLVNIWWMWKYFEAAEQVTDKKVNGVLMFILAVFITSLISSALCQSEYNKLSEVSPSQEPATPVESPATTGATETTESVMPVAPVNPTSQDVVASPDTSGQINDENSTTTQGSKVV